MGMNFLNPKLSRHFSMYLWLTESKAFLASRETMRPVRLSSIFDRFIDERMALILSLINLPLR